MTCSINLFVIAEPHSLKGVEGVAVMMMSYVIYGEESEGSKVSIWELGTDKGGQVAYGGVLSVGLVAYESYPP